MPTMLSQSSSKDKPLKGETIAILVASGFNEDDMTNAQRALTETGAKIKIVSTEQGLAQGWHDNIWSHYFAVEDQISSALAADYSMLLVPGGQRSLDKLKVSAHTTRFVRGFMNAGKPVALFSEAVQLLAHVGMADGKNVTGTENQKAAMIAAGATWSDEPIVITENVMTAQVTKETLNAVTSATVDHFLTIPDDLRMAA
jgi:protease I